MLQVLLVCFAGISLALLFFFGFFVGNRAAAESPRTRIAQAKQASKRQQLQDRLQKLSNSEGPSNLSTGAKCYKQARPPTTADFVCPICGSRTQHTKDMAYFLGRDLPGIKNLLKDLPDVTLTLDVSEFCRKCHPEAKNPKLNLKIQIPGEKEPHVTRGLTLRDARILKAFLEGKDKYAAGFGRERPLKDELPRIRELLGIQAK